MKLETFVGELGSPPLQISFPLRYILKTARLDAGQSRFIASITIGEPVPLEMVHSAIVLLVLNPPMLIRGHTSSVGVLLGNGVGVLDGVLVMVGV